MSLNVIYDAINDFQSYFPPMSDVNKTPCGHSRIMKLSCEDCEAGSCFHHLKLSKGEKCKCPSGVTCSTCNLYQKYCPPGTFCLVCDIINNFWRQLISADKYQKIFHSVRPSDVLIFNFNLEEVLYELSKLSSDGELCKFLRDNYKQITDYSRYTSNFGTKPRITPPRNFKENKKPSEPKNRGCGSTPPGIEKSRWQDDFDSACEELFAKRMK
jgi:hypothetical protein